MIDIVESKYGERIYNLIFNNEYKKEYIYRVSENINIEDNKIIKKSISYDIEVPQYTLYWIPKNTGFYSNILDRQIILPLTLQKKINMKSIDVKINGQDISVTTKEFNKRSKYLLLDYLEEKIFQCTGSTFKSSKSKFIEKLKDSTDDFIKENLNSSNLSGILSKLGIQNPTEYPKDLEEYIKKYINCKYVLQNWYIFSIVLPPEYKPGARFIIKIYYEIPQAPNSTKRPRGAAYHDDMPLPQDEFSRHISYTTPEGLRITNFQLQKHKSLPIVKTPITVLNNSLYFKNNNYIDAKNDKLYPYNKDYKLFYTILPIRQGIRRWSFWVSILITFSFLVSSFIRMGDISDSFYTRTAPTASIIVAISALLISWFSRTEEPPITELIQEKFKWILLSQSISLYASATLLIMTPTSLIWHWGWVIIYIISSLTNIYSVAINIFCVSLEGDKEISYKMNPVIYIISAISILANICLIINGFIIN
jgi:membrane protein